MLSQRTLQNFPQLIMKHHQRPENTLMRPDRRLIHVINFYNYSNSGNFHGIDV